MATKGHKEKDQGGLQQVSEEHRDKKLEEIREDLNRLMLKMQ
jgi:hypothetical protein